MIKVSNKFACAKKSFKCFIGYKNEELITLSCINLPQIIRYVRSFDKAKTMSFLIKDEQLIQENKTNKIKIQ